MREDYRCPRCKEILNNDDWIYQDDDHIEDDALHQTYYQECPYCGCDVILTQEYSLTLEDEYVEEDCDWLILNVFHLLKK